MSNIHDVGLQLSRLSTESKNLASQLEVYSSWIGQAADSILRLLQTTTQRNYQDLLTHLQATKTSLVSAAASLQAASSSAESWLAEHVVVSGGMPYTNAPDSIDFLADTPVIDDNSYDQSNKPIALVRPESDNSSEEYLSIVKAIDGADIPHRAISPFGRYRPTDEIVERLGGGDMTEGSCSSLAFAYVGNKAGYDVLDFRDGGSRRFFGANSSIEMITKLPGVSSETVFGKDDAESANQLLSTLIPGKEYYLATGLHAAIVRKNDGKYEYLELQSSSNNGWQELNDSVLATRFGCSCSKFLEFPNFLIDVDSLADSQEFLDILGYINTAETEQHKGESGHVK